MAAVLRGTPNFTAPPSQNTAPVDEFRCLYTHDIRKKQKKWHDGTVKFHTFNRRVMVYDDARNYVGDLHYRADEDFGEGVELQLDRGVMVEVGEPLGQTQTDVTALVNRGNVRGDTATAAATNATGQSIRRINAVDTQGRPKSLAEVLGASQGRHGRAQLPIQSPFEHRRNFEDMRLEQPPTKKQKVTSAGNERSVVQPLSSMRDHVGKENVSLQHRVPLKQKVVATDFTARKLGVTTTRSIAESSNRPTQSVTSQNVVDLSSDEVDEVESEGARNRKLDGLKNKKQRMTASAHDTTRSAKPAVSKQPSVGRGPSNNEVTRPVPEAQVRPSTMPSNLTEVLDPGSKRGSATLRFVANSKPRPKLFYKALLPSKVTQEATTPRQGLFLQTDHSSNRDVPSGGNATAKEKTSSNDNLVVANLEEMDIDLPDVPAMRSNLNEEAPSEKSSDRGSIRQDSPLFVSQAESCRVWSSPPSRVSEDDRFDVSFTQELCNFVASNAADGHIQISPSSRASTPKVRPSTPSDSPLNATVPVASEQFPYHEPTKVAADAISRTTFSPQNRPNIPPPTSARLFRRVVSENDSTALLKNSYPTTTSPVNSLPLIETPLRPDSLLPAPQISPSPSRRRSPPTQTIIQRSFSDTQAIIPQPLEIETADTSLKLSDEQGPWTKLEAFLLFETWPDSKKAGKPVFEKQKGARVMNGEDGDEDDENDGFDDLVSSKKNVNVMNNFRSARMVLRDEQ